MSNEVTDTLDSVLFVALVALGVYIAWPYLKALRGKSGSTSSSSSGTPAIPGYFTGETIGTPAASALNALDKVAQANPVFDLVVPPARDLYNWFLNWGSTNKWGTSADAPISIMAFDQSGGMGALDPTLAEESDPHNDPYGIFTPF